MVSTVTTAKEQVLPMIIEDLQLLNQASLLDPVSPDGDPGKFSLNGQVARVIHRRDGFYVKINLSWFDGVFAPPEINGTQFYWYVFAIASGNRPVAESYFVCSYKDMINFVLDFKAPLGNDHRDHASWNGRLVFVEKDENLAYFIWRDEVTGQTDPRRIVRLRNVETILSSTGLHELDQEVLDDLIVHRGTYDRLPDTEREAIVRSRIGQGAFRISLLEYWKGCSVTGITNPDILIASHIKPWRVSNNLERLDKYNGLLLTPNLDSLFDKGYVAFAETGSILFSREISEQLLEKLGIDKKMSLLRIEKEHLNYLQFHRSNVFRG